MHPGEPFVTLDEILTQAEAWEQALDVVQAESAALMNTWTREEYAGVLFAGCGSTYYLSLAAAALFQGMTGVPARGVPAGELVMYPGSAYVQKPLLLVAVSRSAETSETLEAVRSFHQNRRGRSVVITNYGERTLAKMSDLTLAIPAGQERSVAQTRSFASMYVAAIAMAATVAGRKDLVKSMRGLPAIGNQLLSRYRDLAQSVGSDLALDRIYFLGSGLRYGLACVANLKMKEMTLTHSEPFHFLEFRHGPRSMAGASALVIGLLSDENRRYEEAVLRDMQQQGAATLSLGESEADVCFHSALPEAVRNVLYLPVLQLMAYYRALAKGLNPDRPGNLDAVVKLEFGRIDK